MLTFLIAQPPHAYGICYSLTSATPYARQADGVSTDTLSVRGHSTAAERPRRYVR